MNQYSLILDEMTWSYSRLKSFEKCPYGFFVHYILGEDEDDTFLSSYGSFIHEIHELVFNGILNRNDAATYYLDHFRDYVVGNPPPKTFSGYYHGGFDYMSHFPRFEGEILAVEKHFDFDVNGNRFTGFADLITKTDKGLILFDHKAKNLKPFSGKKKPLKTDLELAEYYKQLYLYAHAMKQEYGEYPYELVFNCYKNRTMIHTPFIKEDMESALEWADNLIQKIRRTEDWLPDIDYFSCAYLCGLNDRCDYKELM